MIMHLLPNKIKKCQNDANMESIFNCRFEKIEKDIDMLKNCFQECIGDLKELKNLHMNINGFGHNMSSDKFSKKHHEMNLEKHIKEQSKTPLEKNKNKI